jgi:methionyl-tRNA formyltransferase
VNFAFAGTPEFAAWVLRDLESLGRRPSLVISQSDRPRGRGRRLSPSPAAVEAHRLGVECLRTEDMNSPAVLERLKGDAVSTLVVAAFGQILRKPLLDSLLCMNVHASLLPLFRGAAPIERAVAAGEVFTGVSIMRMMEGLDEGPWALQRSVSMGLHDDAGSVGRILALAGAVGLDQVLSGLADGTVIWTEQQGLVSYAGKVCAEDCVLDTSRGAKAAHDQVRSLSPSIGARAASGGMPFKVWRSWPFGEPGLDPLPTGAEGVAGAPGTLAVAGERLFVGCGGGALEVLTIQPAGKGKMAASAFLRGYHDRLGSRLERLLAEERAACLGL